MQSYFCLYTVYCGAIPTSGVQSEAPICIMIALSTCTLKSMKVLVEETVVEMIMASTSNSDWRQRKIISGHLELALCIVNKWDGAYAVRSGILFLLWKRLTDGAGGVTNLTEREFQNFQLFANTSSICIN